MEVLGLIDVPGWIFTVLVISVSLYVYTAYKQSRFRRLGIPGPTPTPFLGTLPELIKKGGFPMDIDHVANHGKYFGAFIGNIPTTMISDPDMIREIAVKQFPDFQDRTQSLAVPKFWTLSVNNAVGAHWRFLRHKTVSETDLLNIQPVFEALTLDVVCSSSFGIEVNSQQNPDDPFVKNAKEAFSFNFGSNPFFLLNFLFPESKHILKYFNTTDTKALKYIKEATQKVIDERKALDSPQYSDLLQLMIDAHKDSDHDEDETAGLQTDGEKKRPLTDDEILANSVMFLLAGYDTTASTLSWLTFCLATNLDVQDRLIREIDDSLGNKKPGYDSVFKLQYLDMVLSETLRLYSPAARINRQVVKDTVICGKKIPGGMSVTFPVSGLHRLPEFWPEPEKFDPERFTAENKEKRNKYTYMPFGVGPRNCIGMRLALLEVKMAIVTLLQRYRVEPTEKLQIPPKISKGIIVKPAEGIWVKLVNRD